MAAHADACLGADVGQTDACLGADIGQTEDADWVRASEAVNAEPVGHGAARPEAIPDQRAAEAEALDAGAVAARTQAAPRPPSPEEIEQHRLTHLPYASWCK
eukprot:9310504-Heterocapsa_arctica.AAC.1